MSLYNTANCLLQEETKGSAAARFKVLGAESLGAALIITLIPEQPSSTTHVSVD